MSPAPSIATIAEYFRFGLETGLLKPEDAKAWAMLLVEEMSEPPYEIIEVSWSKGIASTLEALAEVKGERDTKLAGRWMLGLLRQSIPESDDQLHWVARRGMQIAKIAELGDETYYEFDTIDDELFLAKSNTYGTIEECRQNLRRALEEYPLAPTAGDA
jgi:hypothetical protein